jgi:alkylhydroperoxidase family enzyme
MLADVTPDGERSTTGGLPLPTDAELAPEARSILARMPPLNVFRAIAALPAALRPFLQLGGALLGGEHLTAAERELAILRVAHLTHASYERHQHEQLARIAGLSEAEIAATADAEPDALSDDQRLICRATDEITTLVRLSDEALAEVRARWSDDGARELILLVGYYNMVSRFLESARVPIEDADHLAEGF